MTDDLVATVDPKRGRSWQMPHKIRLAAGANGEVVIREPARDSLDFETDRGPDQACAAARGPLARGDCRKPWNLRRSTPKACFQSTLSFEPRAGVISMDSCLLRNNEVISVGF